VYVLLGVSSTPVSDPSGTLPTRKDDLFAALAGNQCGDWTAGQGLRRQKAFPATVLGPEWFAAMHAPFPMARFVATGGITTKNARSYLDAGAAAISLGSAFAHSPDEEIRALVTYHS
jgi:NAD(P)H-dependent flavin oxidoreductase YrpB (nitropropane dioxygenase family)